ncbi:UDP-forming cellulose synthase catalytic subunit [Roseibium sp. RKSG952]|uniref:UDP-forming cellulose synthase catalytic subunit n=1 Tax=Roseibium sp. RKSG952 TaxID=2529384 RepID=UPI0012BCB575|nr:UDP-forming cellulose synthase catalytic subunit [Roseibium sp. RKSG952]MTH99308.1 UDP-forming cellulose synthase catalytic subunit [Roseibium sp. RKSG952]
MKFFRALYTIVLAFVFFFLLTLPVNTEAQFFIDLMIILSIGVLKLIRPDGSFRLVVIMFGAAIVVRYLYWRTTSTIPPVSELQNFIPGIMLYLAELYSIMMLALSIFIVSMPLKPRPPRRLQDTENHPSVDVFIPTYNEDEDLLAGTLSAALGMEYPANRMKVWLLDDGGTTQKRTSTNLREAQAAELRHEALKKLCASLGVNYLTRDKNEHAKAGNLNNGLAHSSAELVVVFDADHAPTRDFLQETVGFFNDDPKLFLAQTPHFFLNPDPLEKNLRTFGKMPSENEMFYGLVQRGLDKWNGSFFCGSAAVLRRAALEETNGFSGVTITEDCETAISLHARGWSSVYIDRPLIAGLQPATFSSFIGQRSRWAQGMMQILIFHFPAFKWGLSLPQRLCYLSSSLFWLFPFARMIFLLAPLFYLFFDLQIFVASGQEFFIYTSVYIIMNLIMQNYLYGSYRWPLISELYEYIQSVHLLPAVISVFFNPRKPTFKVTSKESAVTERRISSLSMPFFIIFAVLLAGVAVTFYRVHTEPYKADITIVVGIWNFLNLIFAGCALGVVSERGERQANRRIKIRRRCEVLVAGEWHKAAIKNVSTQGIRVDVVGKNARTMSVGDQVDLRITPNADLPENMVPLNITNLENTPEGATIGCQFVTERTEHYRVVADIVFANSAQWFDIQIERRTGPGVVVGILRFLRMSLYQTGRGLIYFGAHIGKSKDRIGIGKQSEGSS